MTQSDVMLELYGASIANRDPRIDPQIVIDWDIIMNFALQQNIIAFVWDGICHLPKTQQPTRLQRINWGLSAQDVWDKYAKQKDVLIKLIDICRKNSLKLLLLKGYGLSLYYPKPQSRASGDIDIYLFDGYEQGNVLLCGGKYVFNNKHASFDFQDVHVENHLTPIDTDSKYQKKVELYIESQLEKVEKSELGYYCLSSLPYLVYLLTHAIRHFDIDNLIPLRQLIDIALFVKANQAHINEIECKNVLERLKIDKSFALFMIIAGEVVGEDIPLYQRQLVSNKDIVIAKYLFFKGQFEKNQLNKQAFSSVFLRLKWYITTKRLYKYIPKTTKEKWIEFRHQMGSSIKCILHIPIDAPIID